MFRFARFRPPRRASGLGVEHPIESRAQRLRQWTIWLLPPVVLLIAHQALFPPAGGFARVQRAPPR